MGNAAPVRQEGYESNQCVPVDGIGAIGQVRCCLDDVLVFPTGVIVELELRKAASASAKRKVNPRSSRCSNSNLDRQSVFINTRP
ncbi:MAG: hypothetical protein Q7O66_09645 [Dehalococcoidia bacterium]|nr:hypothetical protein [Dehalococcoidia bacterium]